MPKKKVQPKVEHSLQSLGSVITIVDSLITSNLDWLDDFSMMSSEKQAEIIQKNPALFDVLKRLKDVLSNLPML